MYENHTDSELLRLLQERNQGAFREIYLRYVDKLFYYAHARVNNREDCKELVHEVFEALWKREHEIQLLVPFLFTVLKFKIINYYEHKTVRRKFSDYINLFKPDLETAEESETEFEHLRALINRSMTSLPDRCQETVRLRIDENLSLDEIAHRMNIDKGSVKRYLTKAMNYLRRVHAPLYRSK